MTTYLINKYLPLALLFVAPTITKASFSFFNGSDDGLTEFDGSGTADGMFAGGSAPINGISDFKFEFTATAYNASGSTVNIDDTFKIGGGNGEFDYTVGSGAANNLNNLNVSSIVLTFSFTDSNGNAFATNSGFVNGANRGVRLAMRDLGISGGASWLNSGAGYTVSGFEGSNQLNLNTDLLGDSLNEYGVWGATGATPGDGSLEPTGFLSPSSGDDFYFDSAAYNGNDLALGLNSNSENFGFVFGDRDKTTGGQGVSSWQVVITPGSSGWDALSANEQALFRFTLDGGLFATVNTVPEPSSLLFITCSLTGLLFLRRRKK